MSVLSHDCLILINTLLFIAHIELWSIVHYYFTFHTHTHTKYIYIYIYGPPKINSWLCNCSLSLFHIWSKQIITSNPLNPLFLSSHNIPLVSMAKHHIVDRHSLLPQPWWFSFCFSLKLLLKPLQFLIACHCHHCGGFTSSIFSLFDQWVLGFWSVSFDHFLFFVWSMGFGIS